MNKACCRRWTLRILDIIFSLTWVCHLVVACWRGTWNLLDLYVLPGDLVSGTWISFFGGVILCAAVKSAYPSLHRNISSEQKVKIDVIVINLRNFIKYGNSKYDIFIVKTQGGFLWCFLSKLHYHIYIHLHKPYIHYVNVVFFY